MNIFKLCTKADEGVVLRSSLEFFQTHFVGEPMKTRWRPPRIEVSNRSKPVRDFVSWMLAAPVVSARAKECLEPLFTNAVEFLPLTEIKGKELYAINVTNILDCLDLTESDVVYDAATSERIVSVRRFHFDLNCIPAETTVFKVLEDPGFVFVSQSFIDVVVKCRLSGSLLVNPKANPFSIFVANSPDAIVPFNPDE